MFQSSEFVSKMSSSSRSQKLRVQKNVQDEKSAKKCQKSDNGFAKGKENESSISSSKKKISEKSDSNPKDSSSANLVGGRPKREVKMTEKAKLLEEAKLTKTPVTAGTHLKDSHSDTPKGSTATRTKKGPTPKTEIRLEKKNKGGSPDVNHQETSVPDVIHAPNVVSKRGTRRKAATGMCDISKSLHSVSPLAYLLIKE